MVKDSFALEREIWKKNRCKVRENVTLVKKNNKWIWLQFLFDHEIDWNEPDIPSKKLSEFHLFSNIRYWNRSNLFATSNSKWCGLMKFLNCN